MTLVPPMLDALPGRHASTSGGDALSHQVRAYWNMHVHDRSATLSPAGSPQFFRDLDAFRFAKLAYLPQRVDFNGYRDRAVLEIGCGAGIDLARFARGGARVTGIDLAEAALRLAERGFRHSGLRGEFYVADGGLLPFPDRSYDLVYCHGVLQYAANPEEIILEAHRVLRPGGEAIFMVYNRRSWMAWMSRTLSTPLEHQDAPVFRLYTAAELSHLLSVFAERCIVPERFPQRTQVQRGWKAALFNHTVVPLCSLVPTSIIRPLGWHLMAYCRTHPSSGSRGN